MMLISNININYDIDHQVDEDDQLDDDHLCHDQITMLAGKGQAHYYNDSTMMIAVIVTTLC